MNTVLEQIKPETAELLAAEAEASGLSIDEYLRNLLPHSNGVAKAKKVQPEEELTPQEKARRWSEWVDKNAISVSHFVDDSRESIYTREDELL